MSAFGRLATSLAPVDLRRLDGLGDDPPAPLAPDRHRRRVDEAKARAVAKFGEALAQRLYPKAAYRVEQSDVAVGGTDFALPGGGFLEAKAAGVGKRVELQEKQRAELRHGKSRIVIAFYTRGCAEVADADDPSLREPATWVTPIAHALSVVFDMPGRWFLDEVVAARGRTSPTSGTWVKATDVIAVVSAARPPSTLIQTLGMCVLGVRVQRAALALYTVGRPSPHFDLRSSRARCTIEQHDDTPF